MAAPGIAQPERGLAAGLFRLRRRGKPVERGVGRRIAVQRDRRDHVVGHLSLGSVDDANGSSRATLCAGVHAGQPEKRQPAGVDRAIDRKRADLFHLLIFDAEKNVKFRRALQAHRTAGRRRSVMLPGSSVQPWQVTPSPFQQHMPVAGDLRRSVADPRWRRLRIHDRRETLRRAIPKPRAFPSARCSGAAARKAARRP